MSMDELFKLFGGDDSDDEKKTSAAPIVKPQASPTVVRVSRAAEGKVDAKAAEGKVDAKVSVAPPVKAAEGKVDAKVVKAAEGKVDAKASVVPTVKATEGKVSGAFAWLWGQIGNILFWIASCSIFLVWRGLRWTVVNAWTHCIWPALCWVWSSCIWPALCWVGSLLATAVASLVSEDVIPKYNAILQKFIKEHATREKAMELVRILVINLIVGLIIMMVFRIITSSQEWTRHVIFLFSGIHGRSMFKEGKMLGTLFVIDVVFCIYYTPGELGVQTAPQKNDVRCENLNSALFAKNLTIPHAFVRRNQLLDCVGRADDGDCKYIVKLAQYERKLDAPILEKHMKSNLLYSRHHHVMYRSNMTSFNLSLGDVTGASNPLTQIANVIWPGAKIDEKSVASPEQIMKDYGHLYMMVDCWRRSQQYAAEMESMNHLAYIFRDVRATGDMMWFTVIRILNLFDEAKYAKQVSMLSIGFDTTLLTFEAFATPWSDNTDYYQKHAINVCSIHPCKFGAPVIMGLKSATSTKNNKCPPPKTCDVCTCEGCNASAQPKDAPTDDKPAQPNNAAVDKVEDEKTEQQSETVDNDDDEDDDNDGQYYEDTSTEVESNEVSISMFEIVVCCIAVYMGITLCAAIVYVRTDGSRLSVSLPPSMCSTPALGQSYKPLNENMVKAALAKKSHSDISNPALSSFLNWKQ